MDAKRDHVNYPRELGRDGPTRCHFDTVDFCIERLRNIAAPFQLRLNIWHDRKMRVTLLDAEIAGVRTLISFRRELIVGSFAIAAEGGVTVSELTQAEFV